MAMGRPRPDTPLVSQLWSLTLPRWATASRQLPLREPMWRVAWHMLRLPLRRTSATRVRAGSAAPNRHA